MQAEIERCVRFLFHPIVPEIVDVATFYEQAAEKLSVLGIIRSLPGFQGLDVLEVELKLARKSGAEF